jgi:hypothetical protein
MSAGTVETMVGWAKAPVRPSSEPTSASLARQRPPSIHRELDFIFYKGFSRQAGALLHESSKWEAALQKAG